MLTVTIILQEVKLKRQVWPIGFHPIQMQQMKAALQGFRAASVTPMEHSAILATSASGGVLQREILQMPGTATCSVSMTMYS